MKNKKKYNIELDVHWPIQLIEHLENNGMDIHKNDIESVRMAVAYDIARKLKHADQGFYVLGDILLKLQANIQDKEIPSFLTVIK